MAEDDTAQVGERHPLLPLDFESRLEAARAQRAIVLARQTAGRDPDTEGIVPTHPPGGSPVSRLDDPPRRETSARAHDDRTPPAHPHAERDRLPHPASPPADRGHTPLPPSPPAEGTRRPILASSAHLRQPGPASVTRVPSPDPAKVTGPTLRRVPRLEAVPVRAVPGPAGWGPVVPEGSSEPRRRSGLPILVAGLVLLALLGGLLLGRVIFGGPGPVTATTPPIASSGAGDPPASAPVATSPATRMAVVSEAPAPGAPPPSQEPHDLSITVPRPEEGEASAAPGNTVPSAAGHDALDPVDQPQGVSALAVLPRAEQPDAQAPNGGPTPPALTSDDARGTSGASLGRPAGGAMDDRSACATRSACDRTGAATFAQTVTIVTPQDELASRSDTIRNAIVALGFSSVTDGSSTLSVTKSQVRYFDPADAVAAEVLAKATGAVLVDLTWLDPSFRTGTIEVVLQTVPDTAGG